MGEKSKIEWTEATWNPVTGCTPISEGCEHCYAKRMATRLRGRSGYPEDEPFKVTFHPEKLWEPYHWRKPRKIFVCSMGDLFHEDIPWWNLNKVFAVVEASPWHRFMVLTKRPQRMRGYFDYLRTIWRVREWPASNLWLGVTAENQQRADERIPVLLEIPAVRRFVSIEPMLGPVDLRRAFGTEGPRQTYIEQLDWVICGGETGPGARPLHPDWGRSLRDQCQAAGVPFFFKSWGEWAACDQMKIWRPQEHSVPGIRPFGDYQEVYRVGKKEAGRMLDGRTWDEEPEDVNVSKEVR